MFLLIDWCEFYLLCTFNIYIYIKFEGSLHRSQDDGVPLKPRPSKPATGECQTPFICVRCQLSHFVLATPNN